MNHRITLYVVDEKPEADDVVSEIVSRWEDRYGGVTTFEGNGHWAGLTESVKVVQTVCMESPLDRQDLRNVQRKIVKELGEEAVLASIDETETFMLHESEVGAKQGEQVRAD